MSQPPNPHHSFKDSLWLYGAGTLLLVAGFVLAYQFVEPAPPRDLRISTGSPQNAYYNYASHYAQSLAKQGISLEVQSSAGSVENLQRLIDEETDVALVQGGISHAQQQELLSLGSLYFEPLWLFYRNQQPIERLTDLRGKRVAIGAPGSGTRSIAQLLLRENAINDGNTQLYELGSQAASDALNHNRIDALFMVTSPSSELVSKLLRDPTIGLMSFTRADAYRSKHRFLSSVTLPEGVVDLTNNIPDRPIQLLAPTATLVTRSDFHPALSVLLLQAATQVHGQGGLFEQPGQFPSASFNQLALNPDAERFFRSGPPFLQRYMPFWAANLIDRLIIMLIPIVTLMIPLSKVLPPTYRWRIRSRIYRWYGQLRELDFRAENVSDPAHIQSMLDELSALEHEVMQLPVPKSYAESQYNLRLHLHLIRQQLERKLNNDNGSTRQ